MGQTRAQRGQFGVVAAALATSLAGAGQLQVLLTVHRVEVAPLALAQILEVPLAPVPEGRGFLGLLALAVTGPEEQLPQGQYP